MRYLQRSVSASFADIAAGTCDRIECGPAARFTRLTARTRQGPATLRIQPLSIANERLDDLQRSPRLTLGTFAPEIGREITVRAKNLLVEYGLFWGAGPSAVGFRMLAHRFEMFYHEATHPRCKHCGTKLWALERFRHLRSERRVVHRACVMAGGHGRRARKNNAAATSLSAMARPTRVGRPRRWPPPLFLD